MTQKTAEKKAYRTLKNLSMGNMMAYRGAIVDLTDEQAKTWLANGTIEVCKLDKTQAQTGAAAVTEPDKTKTAKTTTKTATTKDANQ